MRNYYDDLEVNKNASKEVIEKVYRVLAKKYHPDTTQEENKKLAEEKFKIINEAYEVLSDNEKRKNYDITLENDNHTIPYENYLAIVKERDNLNNALNCMQNEFNEYKKLFNLNNNVQNNYNQAHYANTVKQPTNNMQPNLNNNMANSKKKIYYYTSTGKPASAFAYFKYRIRKFFSDIMLIILLVAVIALIIYHFLH